MVNATPKIKIQNLHKSFGEKKVLTGINFITWSIMKPTTIETISVCSMSLSDLIDDVNENALTHTYPYTMYSISSDSELINVSIVVTSFIIA